MFELFPVYLALYAYIFYLSICVLWNIRKGVWTPGKSSSAAAAAASPSPAPDSEPEKLQSQPPLGQGQDAAPPPVWSPRSASASPTAERKEFRPVKFESPTLSRKNRASPAARPTEGDPSVRTKYESCQPVYKTEPELATTTPKQ
ncbi:uncharacterized protein GBIM_02110 [Gryllus bimaculatus]|nr:uncharacterized protein GBIM_02110 [Gryllus bimaculatus]